MDIHSDNINNDTEEISKKDVLLLTGISYGQFYRWKRMGLIPEEWFRRRSAFTGQETYLPRRRVLERIEQIQTLRQRYSLEEIVGMLSPDAAQQRYHYDDIAALGWISPASLALFPGDAENGYDFTDLVCLAMIERLRNSPGITEAQVRLAADTLLARAAEVDDGGAERRLSLLLKAGINLVVVHSGSCLVDQATRIVLTLDLNRVLEDVKIHLRSTAE